MNENKDILLRKTLKYSLLISIVFNLISCQPSVYQKTTNSSIQVNENSPSSTKAKEMINPYKEKLEAEMNEVLIISAEEFPKERGKPETNLGNLITDLCFNHAAWKLYQDSIIDKPDFCLLNFGGLRTSLPKGEITKGKIYELMPFENELVFFNFETSPNFLKRFNKCHFDKHKSNQLFLRDILGVTSVEIRNKIVRH